MLTWTYIVAVHVKNKMPFPGLILSMLLPVSPYFNLLHKTLHLINVVGWWMPGAHQSCSSTPLCKSTGGKI